MEEYYITLLRHLVFSPLFYSYCLHDHLISILCRCKYLEVWLCGILWSLFPLLLFTSYIYKVKRRDVDDEWVMLNIDLLCLLYVLDVCSWWCCHVCDLCFSRRDAVVKGVEYISTIVLVNIWVARVRVPLVLSVGFWIWKNSTINN